MDSHTAAQRRVISGLRPGAQLIHTCEIGLRRDGLQRDILQTSLMSTDACRRGWGFFLFDIAIPSTRAPFQ